MPGDEIRDISEEKVETLEEEETCLHIISGLNSALRSFDGVHFRKLVLM